MFREELEKMKKAAKEKNIAKMNQILIDCILKAAQKLTDGFDADALEEIVDIYHQSK